MRPDKDKSKETTALRKIASLTNRSLDLKTILSLSLNEIMQALDTDMGFIRLHETRKKTPRFISRGLGKQSSSLLGKNMDEGLAFPNDPDQWEETELATALRGDGICFFALYPIPSGNRILGSIGICSRNRMAPDAVPEDFIHACSEMLGIAVTNAHLRNQANQMSEDFAALQEVNKIISMELNLDTIIQRIVVEGQHLVKTSHCHLFLLDDLGENLIGSASTQTENPDIHTLSIKLSEPSPFETALREKRVVIVENVSNHPDVNNELMETLKCRSAIFAPLLAKEQVIGVLICGDDLRKRKFTHAEIMRAELLAHQTAIALENARLFNTVSRSQKSWETTFDAMQDCVSVHDISGKVIRANVSLARHLKTTPPRVIGRYCSEIYDPVNDGSKQCRHTHRLAGDVLMEEVTLPSMEGVFQISISPWYDKDNNLAGFIHVAKDISKEKFLQQQLIQAEKLSSIGELISGIAHELNNPLTGVMGYSQLLQTQSGIDAHAKENLGKINNLALRCQKIVQNLLFFAREQKPEKTFSDINGILEKTLELRSYELQINNIKLTREFDAALPKTLADAHQLQQVFLNVLINAEQAMLEAHGKGHLLVRTFKNPVKKCIAVEIVDDGPGISQKHLNRIFDPFFTTKEVGKGTGLGLSLSYGMIQEHGGNIYVQSQPGKGARFVIELPIISSVAKEPDAPLESPANELQFENLLRGKKILVVDDEEHILDFFQSVFNYPQTVVDTANNGREAIPKIQGTDYDVIITDFRMPQMSGKELFDWTKEHKPRLAERIIFVTGDTVRPETYSFLENTQNRYLSKPFVIEEIADAIRHVLESE